MKNKFIYFMVFILIMLFSATILIAFQGFKPTPPLQPTSGPGSSNYTHAEVIKTSYGSGAHQYWIYEPAAPTPDSAPVIVFNHGWSAFNPLFYQAWIEHLVKRGNIVIYPRYQESITSPSDEFTPNSIQAIKEAIGVLQSGGHVKPDLEKFAIVGHSAGGLISINTAALAASQGLPQPKAVFCVEPGKSRSTNDTMGPILSDLSKVPSSILLLTLAGDKDDWVGNSDAKKIYLETTQITRENKNYVLLVSDDQGYPSLNADHFAPLAFEVQIRDDNIYLLTSSMDYYGTWKLFDGLCDAAFYGQNREFALGNTSQQRYMGLWSDGTPAKEMVINGNI
jgi:dienelactone hydrolase